MDKISGPFCWQFYFHNSGSIEILLYPFPDSKVHGAHLGPAGPRWAPCWPHELCYQGYVTCSVAVSKAEHILTLYGLNFSESEGTKAYIYIICHSSTLTWYRWLKSFLKYDCTHLQSISWVLMPWRRKEPGHQQPWYLLCWTKLIRSPHIKD